MKKPASSFSSRKPRKKTVSQKSTKRVTRRRAVAPRSTKRRVARAATIPEEVMTISQEEVFAPVMESEPVTPSSYPIESEENVLELPVSPPAKVLTMRPVRLRTPTAVEHWSRESRRMMMWVGVSATMFLLVVGWGVSLYSAMITPRSSPQDETLVKANEQFSNLITEVTQQLDTLKAIPSKIPPPTTATSPITPSLTPEEIDVLKQKVLGTETANTLPATLPENQTR